MKSTKKSPVNVKKILQKARQIILKKGFCKGQYTSPTGRYCTLGALYKALDDSEALDVGGMLIRARFQKDAIDLLCNALPRRAPSGGSVTQIYTYNDAPGTRKSQVIKLFGRAIEMAAKKEDQ